MGITGLLPFLAEATENTHISKFRGGTVAVDTYCWLHKGANACAEQLARGDDTDVYVNYCLKYVKMLLSYDIHVIMVFDGKNLPAKAETEVKRREQRQKAKQRAIELMRLGKTEEARNVLKQAIDITPQMAHKLIEACRKLNVDCIVAPYESDAQLAFFSINDIADCIITEDSDLILFGCKKVMYKMDLTGAGQLVSAHKINTAMKLRPDVYSFDKFRFMCILSGCDYLSSLHGIGLKKALKFFTLTAESDPLKFLDRVPRYLNMRHLEVTEEYKESFMIACATFRHQTVFDPFKKVLVSLTDPADAGTDPKHCKNAGEKYDNKRALKVALGNMHPSKDEVYGNWYPPESLMPSRSIWSNMYRKKVEKIDGKPKEVAQFSGLKTYKQKAEIVSTSLNDNLQDDDDLISTYRKKDLIAKKAESPEKENIVKEKCEAKDTKKNPFVKLSKFNKSTEAPSENVLTKSRYFYTPEAGESNSQKTPDSQNTQDSQKTQDSQSSITSKISHLDIEASSSKKRTLEDNTNTNLDVSIDLTDKSDEENLPAPKQEKKKIKYGPCRSVGLKKQKSLNFFFNKMTKNDK
ncbi:unnamed protein product [Brassicogethes aeneus]|uniref:Exonuclease 1 n=1 Tax=Brassicogethes aeneus TaxID=1431903 RepID=A0A9P0BG04_BRAAE|nr:unnamed protein product [Brassicogethes aeneus]